MTGYDSSPPRVANDANEISGITAPGSQAQWVDPVYDAAGNMTQGPRPAAPTTSHKYVYDAWNRMVKVDDRLRGGGASAPMGLDFSCNIFPGLAPRGYGQSPLRG